MKSSEKTLVGVMLIAAAGALIMSMTMPQCDALVANQGKIDSLNREIANSGESKKALTTVIQTLENKKTLTNDIVIRKYRPDTQEEVIKAILDQVINTAANNGNVLVSLTPYDAPPFFKEPEPEKENTKKAKKNKKSKKKDKDEEATESAPAKPSMSLKTFGYELALRGNYNGILAFLQNMDTSKELIEVSTLHIENEGGADRSKSAKGINAVPADPTKPLRLTAKLRLVLQPE